jgi:hypothetical protein
MVRDQEPLDAKHFIDIKKKIRTKKKSFFKNTRFCTRFLQICEQLFRLSGFTLLHRDNLQQVSTRRKCPQNQFLA